MDVVVAVNGVVGGWADARAGKDADPEVYERFGFEPPPGGPDTARVFAMMVPPELFRDGDNDVDIFVVNDVDGGETLAPARMR